VSAESIATPDMTRDEARECIQSIKDNLQAARRQAYALWSRRGWKTLGYTSFHDCVKAEFNAVSVQHVFRLKDAAIVEHNLSPAGEKPDLPERHARALKALTRPEQQQEAYSLAQQIAATEGDGTRLTTRHVEQAVVQVQAKDTVFRSRYFVVANMVTTGQITAGTGLHLTRSLDRTAPQARGFVVQLMARYNGPTDPDLVPPLAEMYGRQDSDDPSRTLPPIQATGYVAGVPLSRATLTDLKRAQYEAMKEREAERTEQERQAKGAAGLPIVEEVAITVWRGDPEKTFRALKRALSDDDMLALKRLFAGYEIREVSDGPQTT